MKTRAFLFSLMLTLLVQDGVDAKRFDPSMVDPLMRRSPLDKNFMRFGRSSPSFTEEDESVQGSAEGETSKEENFLRSMRGKQDSFMRFGRNRNDNFMRYGRGKQDSFMRFGKSKNGNFMRFGRGKQDNFMRFGRGKQDNYMRFGRGKQDNFMRFGRGKQDNYMRFGRGKQDNFMRFGRGKQDNFMRFGRGKPVDPTEFENNLEGNSALPFSNSGESMMRDIRGKQDNFMRFGKSLGEYMGDDTKISMRSDPQNNMDLVRIGRDKPDNFMRFGKSDEQNQISFTDGSKDSMDKINEGFVRDIKSKDLNLIRLGRHSSNKDNSFIRFGRNSQGQSEEPSLSLIPQRLKRSTVGFFESQADVYPRNFKDELDDHISESIISLPNDLEEEYVEDSQAEDFVSREKRSLTYKSPTVHPPVESNPIDDISSKYVLDTASKTEFPPSLIAAGLPNLIVGPEFSLLPDLDPPSTMLKKDRFGDQSFLRLG